MSVLDASVIVRALTAGEDSGALARRALESVATNRAPAILPAEVTSALRSQVRRGALASGRASWALERLRSLPVRLHPFAPFQRRIWELRENVTVYDAWYVALAESLDVPLVTLDARLAGASGPRCEILLLGEG